MRKQWDEIYMELAHSIAERSTDPKHQVGCVIVSEDNERVLALGYNGDHKGGSNERLSMDHGKSGFIHAENNALIKLDKHLSCKKVMYLTHSPCYACAQLIIQADINKVYFSKEYNDVGLQLLRDQGIDCEYVPGVDIYAPGSRLKIPSTSLSKEEIEKWKESFENNPNGLEHTLSRRFNGDSKTWDKTRADEFG